jgi:hypothetical protein
MSQSRSLRVPLRVVFYREGERWIAHCLEFDLVGDGDTKEEALRLLAEAIAVQVDASLEGDNLANLFTPADGEFFQKYAQGKDVLDGTLTGFTERLKAASSIVEDVKAREYDESSALVPA